MARVTLPAGHAERDFQLAAQVARELGLRELHVFWPGRRARRAAPARRLPARDPFGLLELVGLVASQLGKRLSS